MQLKQSSYPLDISTKTHGKKCSVSASYSEDWRRVMVFKLLEALKAADSAISGFARVVVMKLMLGICLRRTISRTLHLTQS